MKGPHVALLVIGVLLFLAGSTFTLQGYGLLGPASGFMYQNKAWVYAGSAVLVLGFLLAFAGVYASRRRPLSPEAVPAS